MNGNQWSKLRWRLPIGNVSRSLYIATIIGINGLPALANPNRVEDLTVSNSSETLVALDIIDAVKGAIDYIRVANISDEQEVEIGRQTNQQVLQQYRLYNNSQIQQYVRNLGQELVNSSDSRDIPFTFQVVASDEVNAFATPGGFVYVTTGLLKTAENRAQLASVMAHEIAHINEKHGIESLKQAY